LIDTEGVENAELKLFLIRKYIERIFTEDQFYLSSLSTKVIVYKGMLIAPYLDTFYPDLKEEEFESAFVIFHQRYSTNTLPKWYLAQPFRWLAHNGEINTIMGNRNWMLTLQHEIEHEIFGKYNEWLKPILKTDESDTASLDKVFELLIFAGFKPEHAINMLIPPAWEHVEELPDEVKSFFEYQSLLMKPWDGPAAICFTDGENVIGAHLDRNGLRPERYILTEDGLLIVGSEVGMVERIEKSSEEEKIPYIDEKRIIERGRLGPGDTIAVDLRNNKLKKTEEILKELAQQKPYKEWIEKYLLRLRDLEKKYTYIPAEETTKEELTKKWVAFNYSQEEIEEIMKKQAETGKIYTYSMGDDTPLPPLREKPVNLFRFFKQRFAQVTNPPIDPIREKIVMSLKMNLGAKPNFLYEKPEYAQRLQIESPILLPHQLEAIEKNPQLKVVRIYTTYPKEWSLRKALQELFKKALEEIKKGAKIIILSDKNLTEGKKYIPSLLAISGLFQYLKKRGLAHKCSYIVETGEAREDHHIATLIGYGASAVYPYLALQTIEHLFKEGKIHSEDIKKSVENYKKSLEEGLRKILSKMGISTLNSYQSAEIFDTVCLNEEFVEEFFPGTNVTVPAYGLEEIEAIYEGFIEKAFKGEPKVEKSGEMKQGRGEWHAWNAEVVRSLHKLVRKASSIIAEELKKGNYRWEEISRKLFIENKEIRKLYEDYIKATTKRAVFYRDLLEIKPKGKPLPLEEVEPIEEILKRFVIPGMSIGALSPKAHETLAIASNLLGMKMCSGEGGEDPARYGTLKNCSIKQVASGRFGVTAEYLINSKEIEIKIAQGAKPGEGGQLPGHKVNEYIAKLRHSKPGITLISPPPHHDIYSIEDLAQLIHDLKQINPEAHVAVKLVSEVGVGTVASGVAKAYADIVQISGGDGGTGASPYSSIKNAGLHWEYGLWETQKSLMENDLRSLVRIRVDGGLKNGRDVLIASIMGAEEFGFGTASMIAEGCAMIRQCHTNKCPTGVATQDERLIAKFKGNVEEVIAYFLAVAWHLKELMASLGIRKLEEVIGDYSLLQPANTPDKHPQAPKIKVEKLLKGIPEDKPRKCMIYRNDNPNFNYNDVLLQELSYEIYLKKKEIRKVYPIKNIYRTIPTKLVKTVLESGYDGKINLTFIGTAGQSFGAFLTKQFNVKLIGQANDYIAKGLSGGTVIIRPYDWELNKTKELTLGGNTCLYGATSGKLFIAGRVGERFAIRNSGAVAVVEGVGHHCCEYMTGGLVIVLGKVGYNVGAGMTAGIAYILDEDQTLERKINTSYVKVKTLKEEEEKELKYWIEEHFKATQSLWAKEILENWEKFLWPTGFGLI
jgi:glutamate synthase (NADPH/NADH) large chain